MKIVRPISLLRNNPLSREGETQSSRNSMDGDKVTARLSLALPARRAGFTMIEIAIAIGVIGFALVAIIGVLPAGLNVQKEAHQDTTIAQDSTFFLEAIRNGAPINGVSTSQSLDFLTNYVEAIEVLTNNTTNGLTYTSALLTNGQVILGLLSTPEFVPDLNNPPYLVTNFVVARIRGLSGNATEQNGANSLVAFRYYMTVEIDRFNTSSYFAYSQLLGTNSLINASLQNNLYDIRLKFAFPVVGPTSNPLTGPGRQTYRSIISGQLRQFDNNTNSPYWYFQPNSYSTNFTL